MKMREMIESMELDEARSAEWLSKDLHRMFAQAEKVQVMLKNFVKDMQSLADDVEASGDKEYAGELGDKALIVKKNATNHLNDFMETIGSLKLRKGAW